jgi:AcrR family transcriptional regulator
VELAKGRMKLMRAGGGLLKTDKSVCLFKKNPYLCVMKENSKVRTRVLDTVGRLFYEQGFQATGINQIIEESEVAKASLYEHFPSKEDILHEYLEEATSRWQREFEAFIKDKAPGEKTLIALFDYRKKLAVERGFKGCTFVRVVYELPNLDEASMALVRRHKASVRGLIRRHVGLLPGKRTAKEREELTEMIFWLYEGTGVQSTMDKTGKVYEDAKKIAHKLIQ